MKIYYSQPEIILAIIFIHCFKVKKDNNTSQIKNFVSNSTQEDGYAFKAYEINQNTY